MALKDTAQKAGNPHSSRTSLVNDPVIRGVVFQIALALFVVWVIWWFASNTIANLSRANIASGFGFFSERSGFDIAQTVISYNADSSYGRAFLVGLLNTLRVSIIGIIFATILGFLIGIARLSPNWLLAKVATVYVEIFRNVPLLLQLLFWYKAVLAVLPAPRDGYMLPLGASLSNRGLITPNPIPGTGFSFTILALIAAIVAVIFFVRWAKSKQRTTGRIYPVFTISLTLLIGLPLLVFLLSGLPLSFEYPELRGFNFAGGFKIYPEFMALLIGLTIYTAAFIAEIVRAGIRAVSHGQTEAAAALGLKPGLTLRLVVIPQAMRVIIPPLTSQYLNLTKNSSLAVAVGYPDLVSVFSGTVLNQTGQAVEVIFITMVVYLTISLATAGFMNWFNARIRLVER